MLDLVEREKWYEAYVHAGLKFAETRGTSQEIYAWAHSMSLIAEQFIDNHDGEPVDQISA